MSDIFSAQQDKIIGGLARGTKHQGIVDIVAKILATENITVVRANCRTASFNIRTRVLMLPIWKNLTEVVEEMLMCHEVGHALHTTEKFIESAKATKGIKTYLNVLEDVRIERFMKERFPGTKKTFSQGYGELNKADFFEIKGVNVNKMLLIDKINLYFKAGAMCGVSFNEQEQDFVRRADKTLTEDDVTKLAKDIFEYSKNVLKEQQKKEQQDSENNSPEESDEFDPSAEPSDDPSDKKDKKKGKKDDKPETDGEGDDSGDNQDDDSKNSGGADESDDEGSDGAEGNGGGDSDEDESDESDKKDSKEDEGSEGESGSGTSKTGKSTNTPEPEISDEELESKTDKALADNIKDSVDNTTEYNYYAIGKHMIDPIVPYQKILADTRTLTMDSDSQTLLDTQKREWNDVVAYMIKEFELKKAASSLKQVQVSKSGSLDDKKLYAYKIKKDLFKTFTVMPKGKNHGIVMLLDWSGSMDNVLADCIKQIINLSMFCQREGIAFQVFAFTSSFSEDPANVDKSVRGRIETYERTVSEPTIMRGELNFHLLELFSSKMSVNEFKTMISRLLNHKFFQVRNYATGGTPLNEALLYLADYLGPWKMKNNVQKLTFITLTDGAGSCLHTKPTLVRSGNKAATVTVKNFMHDHISKKDFEFGSDHSESSHQSVAILEMIKARYNCSILGFYIMSGNDYTSVVKDNSRINPYTNAVETDILVDRMRKQISDGRFAALPKITGRDNLFILKTSDTRITGNVKNVEIGSDMTSLKAAKALAKELKQTKTSRVLLSQFIDSIA